MSSKEKVRSSKSREELRAGFSKENVPLKPVPPASVPTTSKDPGQLPDNTATEQPQKPCWERCCNYIYDKEHGLFCGRTCRSWWYMIIYSIMYLIFLTTYTLIFLYGGLMVIKLADTYHYVDKSDLISYSQNGIGLTASPTELHSVPLISYTYGSPDDFNKYVKSLDELMVRRRKREITNSTDLGPCGSSPYGYGDEPCVILRVNKQKDWTAEPFRANSSNLPKDLQDWLELKEQKLWLHCDGYHPYDREHIGKIRYFPYPPGFDPGIFPLDMKEESPLIAIQISNFTLGLSLAVECKLWYDRGVSSVSFILYVEPKHRSVRTGRV